MGRSLSTLMAVLMLGLFCISGLKSLDSPAAAATRPNILFILLDDVDYGTAHDTAALPRTLRRLAEEGTSFTRAYAQYGLCSPSRATMLSGLYAQNSGVRRNNMPMGGFEAYHAAGLHQRAVNYHLQQAGYRTGLIGKFINNYPKPMTGSYVPPGWSYWAVALNPRPYDYRVNENGRIVTYGSTPADYDTDVFTAKADAFINAAADAGQPFALYLWYPAVHSPVAGAPRHAGLFADRPLPRPASFNEPAIDDKPPFLRLPSLIPSWQTYLETTYRERLRALQAVDEGIERLYQTLATRGLLNDTYIVFAADNGFHLGEHRLRTTKGFAYEESIRLPLMVRGPGVPAGRQIRQLVGNADLAPTFAAWAGLTTPIDVDGRSFAGLLTAANPGSVPWRRSLPLSKLPEGKALVTTAWPTTIDPTRSALYRCIGTTGRSIPEMRGVRTLKHTLAHYSTGDLELYDNTVDPAQLDNRVCSGPAATRDLLRQRAQELAACRGASCRTIENRPVP